MLLNLDIILFIAFQFAHPLRPSFQHWTKLLFPKRSCAQTFFNLHNQKLQKIIPKPVVLPKHGLLQSSLD